MRRLIAAFSGAKIDACCARCRDFIIWYLVSRRAGEADRYMPMLSDYDFNAATSFTPPNLFLKVDLRPSSCVDGQSIVFDLCS